jgi:hypothetical protein
MPVGDMRHNMSDGEKAVHSLIKALDNPRLGIKGEARTAIIKLFKHVVLGEPIDEFTEKRWRELNRLRDNKIILTSDNYMIELILMALQWDGFVNMVGVPQTTQS